VKVVNDAAQNEEKLFRAALTMTETGLAEFDECVEAL